MASTPSSATNRRAIRRRRSLAAVVAGVTLGAGLTIASGLSGLVPGLSAGASADDGGPVIVLPATPAADTAPESAPTIALDTTGTDRKSVV